LSAVVRGDVAKELLLAPSLLGEIIGVAEDLGCPSTASGALTDGGVHLGRIGRLGQLSRMGLVLLRGGFDALWRGLSHGRKSASWSHDASKAW
jgi:hypothetical protein